MRMTRHDVLAAVLGATLLWPLAARAEDISGRDEHLRSQLVRDGHQRSLSESVNNRDSAKAGAAVILCSDAR